MSRYAKTMVGGLAILLMAGLCTALFRCGDGRQKSPGPANVSGFVSRDPGLEQGDGPSVPGARFDPRTNESPEEIASQLNRWAGQHPKEAAAWVQALDEGPDKLAYLVDVAIAWSENDPVAALEWAKQLPKGEGRQAALLATGYEAARGEPTNALMVAMAMESGLARNRLLLHTLNQWVVSDPVAALQWIETVKEGGLRDELFAQLATALAQEEAESAALIASTTIREGAVYRRAVVAVVQRWAQSDPGAARMWLEQLPDASLRSNGLDAAGLSRIGQDR